MLKMKSLILLLTIFFSTVLCLTSIAQEQTNQEEETDKPSTPEDKVLYTDLCFSPDGKLLAVANSTGTVELLNFPNLDMVKELKGHTDAVYSISFSSDGKLLASGSLDKTIKLWEVEKGKELKTFAGHTDKVRAVCFSHNGTLVASGGDSGEIKLWSVEEGKELKKLIHGTST